MAIVNIVLLIRSLFVLGMIGVLVIAGALFARREKHRASNPDGKAPDKSGSATWQHALQSLLPGPSRATGDDGFRCFRASGSRARGLKVRSKPAPLLDGRQDSERREA